MDKLPNIKQTWQFKASPSTVFAALTDSKILVKWWPKKAQIDPIKGGRFSLVFDNGFIWEGKLSSFKENKSVAFPWVQGTATFKLSKKGKGTLLKLHHEGFAGVEELAASIAGWTYYLSNLKSILDYGRDLRSKEDSVFG
ncbi:MAG TPA: SRPBCC domain-containing protein [Nitrososphaerales archaeon]|nr:SRPBCC domain-containing protein [Nitrososphaerales archaeon]